MGKSATAPPKRTATISSVKAPKIDLLVYTNFRPSFKLSIIGSPIFGFKIGFLEICVKTNKAKIEQAKIVHIDQCTPIQVIENPATAGPTTAPICQTELLQVAAFG